MKKTIIILCSCLFAVAENFAQTVKAPDSTEVLQEVVVKGYEQNRKLIEVGAPVAIVKEEQFLRFSPGNILPAINTVPGVRMEERSPGSYRLSIRGSSLRSPFGVRNVKVYLDGIPFTDAGGTTYLNQLSSNAITSVEVLKGPGSSIYGAGTGGVVLLSTVPRDTGRFVSLEVSGGSYGAKNIGLTAGIRKENVFNSISYSHQENDGYRQQSAMRRDLFSWNTKVDVSDRQSLSTHVIYGDLYYQTPGALTLAEFNANPKQARPAAGAFPSAIQNKAAIFQKTFWAGIEHKYRLSERFENQTSVYGSFSQVLNSAVRNYERRLEPGFGGRSVFTFKEQINTTDITLTGGAEFQRGSSTIRVFNNKSGNADSLQTDDEVQIVQGGLFLQGEVSFASGWIITGGASVNSTSVNIKRFSVRPVFSFSSDFRNEIAPRLSILKKINNNISVYALVSKGFSPPTVAELLPSTTVINTELQAEQGLNTEAGMKGALFNSRLTLDVSAYTFRLQNTISQRRDASGADYFVNTGFSRQRGIEAAANWVIYRNSSSFVNQLNMWGNYTFQHFRYGEFKQLTTDFSGNQIPGVAPATFSGGLTLNTSIGLYGNISYYYSDHIFLNDANTAVAAPYSLSGFRGGYRMMLGRKVRADIFVSGDNVFKEKYSLGNDINAAGNRYYNAAAGRNFQGGIKLSL